MRWLNRVAEMFNSGSAARAKNASPGLRMKRITATATIWIELAIVSGINSTALLICWMSVLA